MASSANAALLHVETGHVLAAVVPVSLTAKPDDLKDALTGGHLRVRVPGTDAYVDIPSENLTVTRIAVSGTVLEHAQGYAVVTGGASGPALSFIGDPKIGGATGDEGAKAVVAWQVGSEAQVTTGTLGVDGVLPSHKPPGATASVVAIAGQPLYVEKL